MEYVANYLLVSTVRKMDFCIKIAKYENYDFSSVSLMKLMGFEAIYPKPNLSIANKEHKKYPYLLRNLVVDRPNQAWAGDITYIPMPKGFGYLFAIIDWFSRYVIAWELSNLLDTDFCLQALRRGILSVKPEIFNADQGVYRNELKIWVFGCFKATKFADLNRLNIVNIESVKIDELRQL